MLAHPKILKGHKLNSRDGQMGTAKEFIAEREIEGLHRGQAARDAGPASGEKDIPSSLL